MGQLFQRRWRFVAWLAFVLVCWQIFWWRFQAIEISKLQVKSAFIGLTFNEMMNWGAICNGLGDFQCSARVFGKALKGRPESALALTNLAIAEAHRGRCRQALEIFDRYRRQAHEGPDSLYWQARCLIDRGEREEARIVLYRAVSMSPEANQSAEMLADLLESEGLIDEALSVVAGLSEGAPHQSERWRLRAATLLQYKSPIAMESGPATVRRIIRLPALDGQNFWVPVRFAGDTSAEFVSIDLEKDKTEFNDHFVREVIASDARSPSSEGLIPALQIGPWLFDHIPFERCQNCQSTIGRSLLERFEVSEDVEAGVRFLVLTPL